MTARLLSVAFVAAAITTTQAQIQTPSASPQATVSQQIGLGTVTVEYGRPSLKGRVMFGDRVPYGKVWRAGANKATNLVLSEEMQIAGKSIPAGRYGLYSIPNETEFTFIVNKDANVFGAYSYKDANDVARFTVKIEKATVPTENLTYEFTDFTPTSANLTLRWENMVAKLPIKHDPDARIMAQIAEQTAKADAKPGVLMAAADYYYETNRDLKQAMAWANKVVEADQKYWTYYLRAKIAAKSGDCKTARADALQSLDMAKKAGDDAYAKNSELLLKQCGQ
ncbi:DUF2911 domain-containing protein [Spirosoma montaniterrae]|uniref:DUF2911 domain-containing protein n=1 Tax=Spirosoma montaniterrae TaxID=1178516 RepID=A0A1P9WZJ6_9BACT|nr:DUF2911 domain-containing protein [Spirosoma montaniterrae]AQG80758.1 hypothetical protein AWR27_16380 [Spirosoma montaniterrae]